ncbi:PH domain-containing protein [Microbacterium sp. bgisy207]|jgi:membrane protein YdbS with pleckstrin-like domain|uniref:PH domain-containing protein n=1 Tax=Microbacterium sp. bgisy207 TaxID=3413800 RepID=UPI003EBF6B84
MSLQPGTGSSGFSPQPNYAGRPLAPAPGVSTPELLIAKIRGRRPVLFLSALVLIAVAAAAGYFFDNLPAPLENWMLLTAAAVVILLLVFLPFLAWRAHVYTITTRRVIERSGLFVTRRRELAHVRGYSVQMRRGPIQRLAGSGTLILSNGVDPPMRIARVPKVALIHEVLIDQVEVNQILAHRDGQTPPEA